MANPRIMMALDLAEPLGADGLNLIQRAILRYLITKGAPVRCSTLIHDLISLPDRPHFASHGTIDVTLLTMSHPAYCSRPIIQYIGGVRTTNGWTSGPCYRFVELSLLGLGLLGSNIGAAPWEPGFLDLSIPYALCFGSATWRFEIEDVPDRYWEQAGKRLCVKTINALGCDVSRAKRALANYQSTRDYNAAITVTKHDVPLGCLNEGLLTTLRDHQQGKAGQHEQIEALGMTRILPHGAFFDLATSNRALAVQSVPVIGICPFPSESPRKKVSFIPLQPACGRHMGQEHNVWKIIGLGDHDRPRTIKTKKKAGTDFARLIQSVPFDPLSRSTYDQMLNYYPSPSKRRARKKQAHG